MKNKKIMFYPVTQELVSLIRSDLFLKNINDIIICDDKGSGLCGKDIATVDGKDKIGCIITEDFEKSVDESDLVVFLRDGISLDDTRRLDLKKAYVKTAGKKIIDYFTSSLLERDFLNTTKTIRVKIMDGVQYELQGKDYYKAEGLIDIEVPIIGVVGLSEGTGKFEVQLNLVYELEKRGYKVSWLSSNFLSSLIDRESFPNFMLEKDMSDREQILFFNRYLKYIEKKENPDVILIGIPGTIMPCTKKITGDFGVLAGKVFRASSPDYLILNMFFDFFSNEYFEEMKNYIKYNYGCKLNAIYVNNKKVDWEDSEMNNKNEVTSYTIEKDKVTKAFKYVDKNNDLVMLKNLYNYEIIELVDDIIRCLCEDEHLVVF